MTAFRILTVCTVVLMAACWHQWEPPSSREAAIQFLRDRDILHERDQVETAEWNANNHCWLIILHLPSGAVSRWWVDPTRKTIELAAVNQ